MLIQIQSLKSVCHRFACLATRPHPRASGCAFLHQGVSAATIQVSLVHYNTGNVVDRLIEALDVIA